MVKEDSVIQNSYHSVLTQLESVGFQNLPIDIPIELVNLDQLINNSGNLAHAKLKGFTKMELLNTSKNNQARTYQMFLLNGLPKVEFEAVLAHELLHVWLHEQKAALSLEKTEGFCNLGSLLIYENDGTQFSMIHLQAMEKEPNPIYGVGYRSMNSRLNELGWNKLLKNMAGINK